MHNYMCLRDPSPPTKTPLSLRKFQEFRGFPCTVGSRPDFSLSKVHSSQCALAVGVAPRFLYIWTCRVVKGWGAEGRDGYWDHIAVKRLLFTGYGSDLHVLSCAQHEPWWKCHLSGNESIKRIWSKQSNLWAWPGFYDQVGHQWLGTHNLSFHPHADENRNT